MRPLDDTGTFGWRQEELSMKRRCWPPVMMQNQKWHIVLLWWCSSCTCWVAAVLRDYSRHAPTLPLFESAVYFAVDSTASLAPAIAFLQMKLARLTFWLDFLPVSACGQYWCQHFMHHGYTSALMLNTRRVYLFEHIDDRNLVLHWGVC